MDRTPFWRRKRLEDMTGAEWESLCDGCGRCCLVRLIDDKSGEIGVTNLACRLLDVKTARCTDYANRRRRVPGCVKLTPARARSEAWLPETCAYRRLALGKDLPDWHPLVSGRTDGAALAGIGVAGWAISEDDVEFEDEAELWDFVIEA